MIDEYLAKAIANVAAFLEFSKDDVVNEDAAIEAMEQLATDLQAMNHQSRAELSRALKTIAPTYHGKMVNFVSELPNSLGIL